ncbi:MAG: hypothetical protein H0X24_19520 [Ktedonobacterales bacterium]|nr:hypothetical protein [Ktedonobacterales bacterium]
MADKQYAQTIQQALDAEIASLVAQQQPASGGRSGAPPPPAAEEVVTDQSGYYQDRPAPQPITPPASQAAPGGSAPNEKARKEAYGSTAAPPPPPAPARAPAPASVAAPLPSTHTTLANLDQRIVRLMQVRDWIQEDGDIARLIDTVIGKQVQSSERRQARLAVALNVIFLVAGWALSLVASPGLFSHLLAK